MVQLITMRNKAKEKKIGVFMKNKNLLKIVLFSLLSVSMGMYATDDQVVVHSSQFPTTPISVENQIQMLMDRIERLTTKLEQSDSENEKLKSKNEKLRTVLAKTVATYKMLLEKKDQRIKELELENNQLKQNA